MSGLIDWVGCESRKTRACHRRAARATAGGRGDQPGARRRTSAGRRPWAELAEFAILRPVFRLGRPMAAGTPCRRSARRSSMDRTSAS